MLRWAAAAALLLLRAAAAADRPSSGVNGTVSWAPAASEEIAVQAPPPDALTGPARAGPSGKDLAAFLTSGAIGDFYKDRIVFFDFGGRLFQRIFLRAPATATGELYLQLHRDVTELRAFYADTGRGGTFFLDSWLQVFVEAYQRAMDPAAATARLARALQQEALAVVSEDLGAAEAFNRIPPPLVLVQLNAMHFLLRALDLIVPALRPDNAARGELDDLRTALHRAVFALRFFRNEIARIAGRIRRQGGGAPLQPPPQPLPLRRTPGRVRRFTAARKIALRAAVVPNKYTQHAVALHYEGAPDAPPFVTRSRAAFKLWADALADHLDRSKTFNPPSLERNFQPGPGPPYCSTMAEHGMLEETITEQFAALANTLKKSGTASEPLLGHELAALSAVDANVARHDRLESQLTCTAPLRDPSDVRAFLYDPTSIFAAESSRCRPVTDSDAAGDMSNRVPRARDFSSAIDALLECVARSDTGEEGNLADGAGDESGPQSSSGVFPSPGGGPPTVSSLAQQILASTVPLPAVSERYEFACYATEIPFCSRQSSFAVADSPERIAVADRLMQHEEQCIAQLLDAKEAGAPPAAAAGPPAAAAGAASFEIIRFGAPLREGSGPGPTAQQVRAARWREAYAASFMVRRAAEHVVAQRCARELRAFLQRAAPERRPSRRGELCSLKPARLRPADAVIYSEFVDSTDGGDMSDQDLFKVDLIADCWEKFAPGTLVLVARGLPSLAAAGSPAGGAAAAEDSAAAAADPVGESLVDFFRRTGAPPSFLQLDREAAEREEAAREFDAAREVVRDEGSWNSTVARTSGAVPLPIFDAPLALDYSLRPLFDDARLTAASRRMGPAAAAASGGRQRSPRTQDPPPPVLEFWGCRRNGAAGEPPQLHLLDSVPVSPKE